MTCAEGKETSITANMNLIASFMLAFLCVFISSPPAHAAFGVLSKEDKACLECHSKKDFGKAKAGGDAISLHVAAKPFSESVHNDNGCTDCHTELDAKKHAKADNKKLGTREYSIAAVAVCRDCHKKNVKLYDDSLHATLVRDGNAEAPICSDCHDPHTTRVNSATGPMDDVVCQNCHGKIFKAYASSVHGQARGKQSGKLPTGQDKAPICADCHRSHEIKAAATAGRIKNACLDCHKGTLILHKVWLPNAERHFDAVSCPACHVATAKRRVDLRLYDSVANKEVTEKQGVPQFESRTHAADTKGLGLDALALQSLLKDFNREGGEGRTVLRGRLEVSSGIEAHQLVDKSKAIKDCDTCHREGADVFQTVTISIARPDGRPIHHGAQKEVLTSPISVDSVRGFYAIGGTRIKLLDYLFVLALFSGIAVPVGHMTLKWLFRRYLNKLEAERSATQDTQQ